MSSGITSGISFLYPVLPEGTSLVPGGLVSTYGAVLISIILSGYLLGILTVQAYIYYSTFSEDPKLLKYLIALICILDFGQFVACVDFAWWYVITNWGNVAALVNIRPSFGLEVILGASVVALVELFFLFRIWILSRRFILVVPVVLLIIVQYTFGVIGGSFGLQVQSFVAANNGPLASATVIVWLGAGLAADCSISAILCVFLFGRRTGFEKTDGMVNKVILYTMNTCLLTTAVALTNVITFFLMRSNFIHVAFNMLLCKLFSNSLLASLNRRSTLRRFDDREQVSHLDGPVFNSRHSKTLREMENGTDTYLTTSNRALTDGSESGCKVSFE